MAVYIKKIKNSITREFDFPVVEKLSIQFKRPTQQLSIPNVDKENTTVVSVEGATIKVNVSFLLKNSTTDISNGTAPTPPIKTIQEQFQYFYNEIMDTNISAVWMLFVPDLNKEIQGVLEFAEIPNEKGNVTSRKGDLVFTVGK